MPSKGQGGSRIQLHYLNFKKSIAVTNNSQLWFVLYTVCIPCVLLHLTHTALSGRHHVSTSTQVAKAKLENSTHTDAKVPCPGPAVGRQGPALKDSKRAHTHQFLMPDLKPRQKFKKSQLPQDAPQLWASAATVSKSSLATSILLHMLQGHLKNLTQGHSQTALL